MGRAECTNRPVDGPGVRARLKNEEQGPQQEVHVCFFLLDNEKCMFVEEHSWLNEQRALVSGLRRLHFGLELQG